MPSTIFKSNGLKALDLWAMTNNLKGDETSFRVRNALREKILHVWPEVDGDRTFADSAARHKTIENDIREIEITPEDQYSLSEGFLRLIRDPQMEDTEKSSCVKLAKMCGFSKWLNKHISKAKAREFTESDDAVEPDDAQKAGE